MSEEKQTLLESITGLFGLEIKKKESKEYPSIVPKDIDDGALLIAPSGIYGQYIDIEGKVNSDHELISRYRELALQPEIDFAVNDIVNESIIINDINPPITLNLDEIKYSPKIKKSIEDEFQNILSLLNFNNKGHNIFRQWYIDGRLYYHVIVEEGKEKEGIKELRNIDPRRIRKVKEVKKEKDNNGFEIVKGANEYFIFNKNGFIKSQAADTSTGIKISPDAIIYTTSGIYDPENLLVLSHLHKAIKPFNQLKMLEDATIIYHLSRAPERRVFYVDVGNLPTPKAEQYLSAIQSRYKNKMVYDAQTGEVRDDKRHMSMLEDYWIPRREGGRGTEISALGGGQNLTDNIESADYFRKRLYRALNVPISRLEQDNQWSLGRATEISRDEMRFSRFVERLRAKFNDTIDSILEKQLILKGIISPDDWVEIKKDIKYIYSNDSYFSEMKEIEVIRERFNLLRDIDDYTTNGVAREKGGGIKPYISVEWVKKHVLQQDDEDEKKLNQEIDDEVKAIEDAIPDDIDPNTPGKQAPAPIKK